MKWGRHKSSYDKSVKISGGRRTPAPVPRASQDAKETSSYAIKAKAGGTAALSTKELQTLVNRQNLEAQYARLNPAPVSAGQKIVGSLMPAIGTAFAAQRELRKDHPAFAPAQQEYSTAIALPRTKQKMMADIVLATGKQVIADHGIEIGMALAKSLLK